MTVLGIINCNPLNIRYNPMNKWLGQTGSDKGFCVFDSMEHGFRAALVLLCNYQRKGYDTIYKIVSHWAPPSENNTEAYVAHCCRRLGYLSESDLWIRFDAHTRITSYDVLFDLAGAMCEMEIGSDPMLPNGSSLHEAFYSARKNYKYPKLCV